MACFASWSRLFYLGKGKPVQKKPQGVRVYVDGELKGVAQFSGGLSRATLSHPDFVAPGLSGNLLQIEFVRGDRWEYFCFAVVEATSGRQGSERLELNAGKQVDSQ